ncbi:MAG: hypothetical protein JWL95_2425 [Gemmatimonadetes bacterium]|nr:hypothetical protein [Gemmatimonadota bacterium]
MRIALTHTVVAVAAAATLTGAARATVGTDGPKAPKPAVVTIIARDYAFQAPDSIAAGRTTLRLVNKGPDFHHVWLMKLDAGKRLTDLSEAMKTPGPLPKWAHDVGGPNAPMPGGEVSATLDLEPGTYVMACVIPAMKDGQPHFMKGMVKEIVVTPRRGVEQAGQPLPSVDVAMTLSDYDFAMSAPITSATRSIRVRNVADQTHEVVFVKLAPGATALKFAEAIEKPQGPPPGVLVGGITGIAKGRTIDVATSFTAGDYALICFVPDDKDGKAHLAHGMIKQITVK